MNAIEQLKSVLCDPRGGCCIAGSDEDRAIVDRALQALSSPVQQPPRFPTMLRKMWSGAEVQAWIDEHWHSAQEATPAIPSGWTLTLDGQHFKLKSPEGRWWDFGPNTDGPDRLVWEFLSAMRDGVPARKGGKP